MFATGDNTIYIDNTFNNFKKPTTLSIHVFVWINRQNASKLNKGE